MLQFDTTTSLEKYSVADFPAPVPRTMPGPARACFCTALGRACTASTPLPGRRATRQDGMDIA